MSYDNKLELKIDIDAKSGNAEIQAVNTGLNSIERSAVAAGSNAARGLNAFERGAQQAASQAKSLTYEQMRASTAAQMLAMKLGIEIPEGARRILATSKLIGPALTAAFSTVGVVAIGLALFEAGKALYNWITDTKKATAETKALREEQERLTKAWLEHASEVDKRKRELAGMALADIPGFEGASRRGALKIELSKRDVDIAKLEFDALSAKYNRLYLDASKTDLFGQFTPEAKKALKEFQKGIEDQKDIQSQMAAARAKWEELQLQLVKDRLEVNKQINDALQKQTEWIRDQSIELDKLKTGERANLGALMFGAIEKLPDAGKQPNDWLRGLSDDWIKKTEEQTAAYQQLKTANDDLTVSLAKRSAMTLRANASLKEQIGSLQQVLAIELDALNKQKEKYGITAAEIEQIERHKGMQIQKTQMDIADAVRNQFERTAQSIEGFFDRVFLSAKSFSDVWKQLWTQAVSFIVKQFTRMAAGWLSTHVQMFSGGQGGFGGFSLPWGGSGGSQSGWGGSLNSSPGGGYNLNQLPGWGGSAAGTAGASGNVGNTWFGLSGNYAGMARGGAGAVGSGLFSYGLAHPKTVKGDLSLMGGGAATGASIGGPFGAVAGAAVGSSIAGWRRGGFLGFVEMGGSLELLGAKKLFGKYIKSAETKARESIKSTYGVDISQRDILQQAVQVSKQGYGGDIRKAIAGPEIRDLVELYAMTTGQATKGMPARMTAGNLVQSGGGLYSSGAYSSPAALPGSDYRPASAAPTTINITIPGAKDFFRDETVTVIANSGRVVQKAAMSATKANSGRREMAALQLSPGTLTS